MRIFTIKMAAFRNCFKANLTVEQIALARGVSAAVCCAILSTVLVVFVILAILPKTRNRVCGTLLKCLSFGLIAVSVLHQLLHCNLCITTTMTRNTAK